MNTDSLPIKCNKSTPQLQQKCGCRVEIGGSDRQEDFRKYKKKPGLGFYPSRVFMEAAGIEPASRNVSTFPSTCVVECIYAFAPAARIDTVRPRLAEHVF
jgi:hypothetical protein